MYNAHRGLPPGPAPPPNNRLAELLEQVRAEFEVQGGRTNEYEHQRKSSFVSYAPTRHFPDDKRCIVFVVPRASSHKTLQIARLPVCVIASPTTHSQLALYTLSIWLSRIRPFETPLLIKISTI